MGTHRIVVVNLAWVKDKVRGDGGGGGVGAWGGGVLRTK